MNTYIEDNVGFSRTFRLNDRILTVEKKLGGRTVSEDFDVTRVSSASTRAKLTNIPALKRSLTYLGIVTVFAVLGRAFLPVRPIWIGLAMLFVSLPGLRVLLGYFSPVEVEQFKDPTGRVVFDFIRSRKRSAELDEFLGRLRVAIEATEPPQRNAGSRPSPGDSSASETPSSLGPRGSYEDDIVKREADGHR